MARYGSLVLLSTLAVVGCGRTDALWLGDEQADDTTAGDGDGDTTGDGDGDGGTTSDSDDEPTTGDGDGDTSGDGDGEPTTGDGDGDGDANDDIPCQDMFIDLTPEPSTTIFLVDQGSHMDNNFGGLTRLEAIGVALFDPMQGVAWTWESTRRMGLVAFTSFNGSLGGECPVLEVVAPEVMSAVNMETTFTTLQPEDENPVADALAATVPMFAGEPGHVILLTGRDPDTCGAPNPQQGDGEAVLAAETAFSSSVETHVVAVGQLDGGYTQALANAGAGVSPQDPNDAQWSAPSDLDGLRTVLDGLLASFTTCELNLGAPVPLGIEADCQVDLDGEVIPFGEQDGWFLQDADRMFLDGAACEAYVAGATPFMICPCE